MKIMIAAARGRCRGGWHESEHYQQLEMRPADYSNSLTHVAKDNYIVEQHESNDDSLSTRME